MDRRESRGGHFREDYPEKRPEFAPHNTIIHRGEDDGQMHLRRQPLPPMREDLKKVIEEQK